MSIIYDHRKWLLGLAAAFAVASGAPSALAQDKPLKIGVIGGLMDDTLHGTFSLEAVKMAIEDAGGKALGMPIEVLSATDQFKPDIGIPIVKEWIESQGVSAIFTMSPSNVALGVLEVTKANDIPLFLLNAGSSAFTGTSCSPLTTQWVWDTYATTKPVVDLAIAEGKTDWYLATSDYSFGYAVRDDFTSILNAAGGELRGATFAPLETKDFSSNLLEIRASGASGVAISIGAGDQESFLKQMNEFGMDQSMSRMMFTLFTNQIAEAGLDTLGGVQLAMVFYHDQNEETRAWTKRYMERTNNRVPNVFQASAYEAAAHYLKAVEAAQTFDGPAVVQKMREIPINDFGMKDVRIREDGQVMRPMMVAQVKTPEESTDPHSDLVRIIGEIPAEQAWRTLEDGGCALPN